MRHSNQEPRKEYKHIDMMLITYGTQLQSRNGKNTPRNNHDYLSIYMNFDVFQHVKFLHDSCG